MNTNEARPGRWSGLTALDWIAAGLVGLGSLGLMASRLWVTPAFMQMYQEFAAELPWVTKLVASEWYAIGAGLLPLALLALALLRRMSLGRQRLLVVIGFFLVAGLAYFYWWGLYLPVRLLADAVSG